MAPRKTAAAASASTAAPAAPVAAASTSAPPPETPAPAAAPEVTEDAAVVVAADAVSTPDISSRIGQLALELASLISKTKEVVAALKLAQRDVLKLQKQKEAGGRRRRGARASGTVSDGGSASGAPARKPSGFAKPAKLSPQLCTFLGVAPDTELARMDVTRRITEYIKANNLNDSKDRRNITPDANLQAILAGPKDKPVTYFNLQAHIKHHFVKDAPLSAAPATAVTA